MTLFRVGEMSGLGQMAKLVAVRAMSAICRKSDVPIVTSEKRHKQTSAGKRPCRVSQPSCRRENALDGMSFMLPGAQCHSSFPPLSPINKACWLFRRFVDAQPRSALGAPINVVV